MDLNEIKEKDEMEVGMLLQKFEGITSKDFQDRWQEETLRLCYCRTLCERMGLDYVHLPIEDVRKLKLTAFYRLQKDFCMV